MLHDVVLRRTIRDGRVRVQPLPPDELLIDRRAVSLDEAPFVAHRVKRTISELIEMGYARAKVIDLAGDDAADYSLERLERFQDEDELPWRDDAVLDPTMREVWITECYIRVDYDGDGLAELRKVTVAGDGTATILDNQEIDDHTLRGLMGVPARRRRSHGNGAQPLADRASRRAVAAFWSRLSRVHRRPNLREMEGCCRQVA
jgi:hypothetical protein